MRVTSSPLIRFLGTVTNPAAETKSIGLSADTMLSWFLQRHLDNYSMTWQILPVYQDYAIWTVPSGRENPRPSTGTFAKTLPAPTQTATPHTTEPLAKMCGGIKDIRLPALQVIKCIITRFLFTVYQFVPRCATGYFKIYSRGTNPANLTTYIASRISLPTHL